MPEAAPVMIAVLSEKNEVMVSRNKTTDPILSDAAGCGIVHGNGIAIIKRR